MPRINVSRDQVYKGGSWLDLCNKIVYPGSPIIMFILSLLFSSNTGLSFFHIPSFLISCSSPPPMARKISDIRHFPLVKSSKKHSVAESSNRETKHHTKRAGELRFIMSAGSKELTLQALSPKQRGHSFIYRL